MSWSNLRINPSLCWSFSCHWDIYIKYRSFEMSKPVHLCLLGLRSKDENQCVLGSSLAGDLCCMSYPTSLLPCFLSTTVYHDPHLHMGRTCKNLPAKASPIQTGCRLCPSWRTWPGVHWSWGLPPVRVPIQCTLWCWQFCCFQTPSHTHQTNVECTSVSLALGSCCWCQNAEESLRFS